MNRSSSKVKTYSTKNEEKRAEEKKDEGEEQSFDVEKPTTMVRINQIEV